MSLLAAYLLWAFHAYFIENARTDLAARTGAAGESIAEALVREDAEGVWVRVRRYAVEHHISLEVVRPDAQPLAYSGPAAANRQLAPGLLLALSGTPAGGIDHSRGFRELYHAVPLVREGRLLGALRMSRSLEPFEARFSTLVRTVLLAVLVTFALCVLAAAWLARNLAVPIQEMRNFAGALGERRFGRRLTIRRRDELGQLAGELNAMSERLEQVEEQRWTFLANISHELRTPVSNLQVTLEALQGGADAEPELRGRFMRTCLDEITRLSRLVGLLLEVGCVETGALPLDPCEVRLRWLLARARAALETRLLARGLRLEIDVPDATLWADPERLLQVFINLFDNAINYTDPESTITVWGRLDGRFVLIEVRDQGPGIDEALLQSVFEQFFTGNPGQGRGGRGLGLPIARRIVEAHGGTIAAARTTGKGAVFQIWLPLYDHGPVSPVPNAVSLRGNP
jgi:signal transduction histidine kinase